MRALTLHPCGLVSAPVACLHSTTALQATTPCQKEGYSIWLRFTIEMAHVRCLQVASWQPRCVMQCFLGTQQRAGCSPFNYENLSPFCARFKTLLLQGRVEWNGLVPKGALEVLQPEEPAHGLGDKIEQAALLGCLLYLAGIHLRKGRKDLWHGTILFSVFKLVLILSQDLPKICQHSW